MSHSAEYCRGRDETIAEIFDAWQCMDPAPFRDYIKTMAYRALAEAEAREAAPDAAVELELLADHIQEYIGPDAARDSRMKALGAAEWLEQRACEVSLLTSADMKQEAARLRREAGK